MRLAKKYKCFPFGLVIIRTVIAVIPLSIVGYVGIWLQAALVVLTILMSYFLIGMTLYRRSSPWRRVGHLGFTEWLKMLSARSAYRRMCPDAYKNDLDLWRDALKATLSHLYLGIDEETAYRLADSFIEGALGNPFVETLDRQTKINKVVPKGGIETMATTLRSGKNMGGAIIVFSRR